MFRNRYRTVKGIALCAVLLVAAALGMRPLVDVDLGWHLAGGFFMLDYGVPPGVDPFGAEGRPWWCYSWLFEVVSAWIFRLVGPQLGFEALQLTQLGCILLSASMVWALIFAFVNDEEGSLLAGLLALPFVLLLVAPTWHLRPQLISVVLFAVYSLIERRSGAAIFLLAVLWANIHVYWVFVPAALALEVLLEGRRERLRLLCLCAAAGFLTPYPLEAYRGLFEYAFYHGEANRLIREFQPLGRDHGVLSGIVLAVLSGALFSCPQVVRSCRPHHIALFLLFAALGARQVKFVPLFGVALVPVLVQGILPALTDRLARVKRLRFCSESSATAWGIAGVLSLALLGAVYIQLDFAPALRPQEEELLALAAEIQCAEPKAVVLNHFDNGGWIALGFSLAGRESCRTAIDGRTLVMGEARLRDFQELRNGRQACDITRRWNVRSAILPMRSQMTTGLRACGWSMLREGKVFALFVEPTKETY